MDHGLPQVLCCRLAGLVVKGNSMGGVIMLHYDGMIDRQVGRALLEILHRVAARSHHLSQQIIGMTQRGVGVAHELSLDLLPVGGEARLLVG